MGELQHLASATGADERTLRRAVELGTIHGARTGPRSLRLDADERAYLKGHWELLAAVRRVLRTEPNVRLAVLYGSTARGDDGAESDLDLLVSFRRDSPQAASRLARQLEEAIDRDVDIARLPKILARQPLLLVLAIDEGRVLVDREREWPRLLRKRGALARRAAAIHEEQRRGVAASLARDAGL